MSSKNNFRLVIFFAIFLGSFLFIGIGKASAATSIYYDPYEPYTPPTTSGPTYYVSGTTGNNSYDGLAPTSDGTHGPWKTIGKYLNPSVDRGKSRLLIEAGKYYGSFAMPSTWTYGNNEADRTIIAAYGDGEVILDDSITPNLGDWSGYSGNIWQATFNTPPSAGVQAVVIDNDFKTYHPQSSLANVSNEGDWYYDSSSHKLYVQTPAAIGNPSAHDLIVVGKHVSGAWPFVIGSWAGSGVVKYVTFSGLTVRGSTDAGISTAGVDHVRIEKNNTVFNGGTGISFSGDTYGEMLKNRAYGNELGNWPRGSASVWGGGTGGSGDSNMLIAGNVVIDNGGEGIVFYDTALGHNTYQDNIAGDNFDVNIYLDANPYPIVRRNFLYATDPDIVDVCTFNCALSGGTASILQRMSPTGIDTADENYADAPLYTGGQIYNNIILGGVSGFGHLGGKTGSGLKNTNIYNNTIIITHINKVNGDTGIWYNYNSGNNSGSVIENNLIVAYNINTFDTYWLANGDPNDPGITWDHNLYYAYNNPKPFYYKQTQYNFSNWKSQTSQDANSIYADPLLNRTDWSSPFDSPTCSPSSCSTVQDITGVNINDFIPQPTSPAINAGIDVGLTSDYAGNPIVGAPDIGAYEYQGTVASAPSSDTTPPAAPTGLSVI